MPTQLIGDKNRITQVTNNLVSNAIQFAIKDTASEITAKYDVATEKILINVSYR